MRIKRAISTMMLALGAAVAASGYAQARTVTLDSLVPTVRLCPVTCISVSGHKFRPGTKVSVIETRRGWARISPWLDDKRLRRSFGDRVPKNPAYWVDLRRTTGLSAEKTKEQAKTASRLRRQQRRVTLPKARPGYTVASVYTAEDNMMSSVLKVDRVTTARVANAALSKTDFSKSDFSQGNAFVNTSLPVNPSKRALAAESLTTQKMSAWIEANRGSVIEDLQEVTAALSEPRPEEIKSGKQLEKQIVALKDPVASATTNTATQDEFDTVPEVMTSALLDKRLSVLPGMNSKVPEETVIALRHFALGLLEKGECKGIAGGGNGSSPNTVYLVCTDDLMKTREFKLQN